MLETYEAVVQPNGFLGFRDPQPPIFYQPTDVLVTIRKPSADAVGLGLRKPNGAAILEKLRNRSFPQHLKRSAEEIQAQINEERNAWD